MVRVGCRVPRLVVLMRYATSNYARKTLRSEYREKPEAGNASGFLLRTRSFTPLGDADLCDVEEIQKP